MTTHRETIERAVGYGNDPDTTAAIAGDLAGLHWGLDGIPAEWLAALRGRDLVEGVLTQSAGDPRQPA